MTERNSFLWWYFDLIFSHGLNQDWKIVHFCCFNVGDCLITVATGPLSDSDADRAGLVSTHAYALLDIRKVQVGLWLYYGNCTAYLKVKTAVNLCPADSLSFSDSQPRKKTRSSAKVVIRVDSRYIRRLPTLHESTQQPLSRMLVFFLLDCPWAERKTACNPTHRPNPLEHSTGDYIWNTSYQSGWRWAQNYNLE